MDTTPLPPPCRFRTLILMLCCTVACFVSISAHGQNQPKESKSETKVEGVPATPPTGDVAQVAPAPVVKPLQIGPLAFSTQKVTFGPRASYALTIKGQNSGKNPVAGKISFTLRVGNKKDAWENLPVELTAGEAKEWKIATHTELEGTVILAARFIPALGKASTGELRVTVPAEIAAIVKRRKEERAAQFVEVKVQAVKGGDGFFRYYIGAWNRTGGQLKGKLTVGKFTAQTTDPQGEGAHSKVRQLNLAGEGFNQGYIDWNTGPPCEHGEFGVTSLGWVFESADGKQCSGNAPVPDKITDRLPTGVEMAD